MAGKTQIVTMPCVVCNKRSIFQLDADKVVRWQNGELIQNAFPELSVELRECLITGTHPKCWIKLWGNEEGI